MRQLSLGVLAGSMLSVVVFVAASGSAWAARGLLVGVAAIMLGVASVAAVGLAAKFAPANRRGFAVRRLREAGGHMRPERRTLEWPN